MTSMQRPTRGNRPPALAPAKSSLREACSRVPGEAVYLREMPIGSHVRLAIVA